MKKGKISIVTVSLNCKEDLKITAMSVRKQKGANYEYIIKDGLSTDGTIEVAARIGPDQLIVKKDNGVFDAMNQALEHSNGEYVYFLNAGDTFVDDRVLHDIYLEIEKNRKAVFYYGNIVHGSSRSGYIFHPKKLRRYYLYTQGLCHQAWFVERNTYIKYGGFETREKIGGDYVLMLKMLVRDKIRTQRVDRFVAVYKGGGISTNVELYKRSEQWRREVRKEIFGSLENSVYKNIGEIERYLKHKITDERLERIYKKIYALRYRYWIR